MRPLLSTTEAQDAVLRQCEGVRQCGATLLANAAQLAGSAACTARLGGHLAALAAMRVPVALRVLGMDDASVVEQFYVTCRGMRDAFAAARVDSRLLEITITSSSIPLHLAWQVRQTLLGNGLLNVVLDAATVSETTDARGAVRFWQELWQLRASGVRCACWPVIRSACKLLSPESATDVLPELGLQVPPQTAWLRGEFNLCDFADDHGHVSLPNLSRALTLFIKEAELRYDTETWATPAMQYDAWYNRRVAIVIAGIGDVARRRGLDPECHDTLVILGKLLRKVRKVIVGYSRALALRNERLPSIAATDPCLHLNNNVRESCWQRRWNAALERHALRHRNLLVMSPWSLFPEDNADFRYTNLLPLLSEADACEFKRIQSLKTWTARQLQLFHCRAWALNNTVLRSMVVAEQP